MYRSIESNLPRERTCSSLARRLVEEQFSHRLTRQTLDDLKLVVSELVDNAYLHGLGQIRIKLQGLRDSVRVEVMDEGQNARIQIRPGPGGGGGNGLRLVDHVCPQWGSFKGSTHVWAEVPVQGRSALAT